MRYRSLDYEAFNNSANPSDEDYFAFAGWLSKLTATELREAKGDADKEKQALCRFYARGERANLTPSELIDFLCVSTPSILDRAGYSETEGDDLMRISDSLAEAELKGASPQE